jgi:SP family arabinose:H+ symporter-like MFS transporter
MNALISGLFPILATRSAGYPILFFCCMVILQFFVVFFFFPETKGVTLEQMQRRLEME